VTHVIQIIDLLQQTAKIARMNSKVASAEVVAEQPS